MLRAAAVLLVGTAAFVVPSTPALADGGVVVTLNGKSPRVLSRALLHGTGNVDQPQVIATRRSTVSGVRDDSPYIVQGTTAKRLVELADVGPPAVTEMSITYAGFGEPVTLTGDEVRGEGFTGDPKLSAAIFDPFRGASEVVFFRPLRFPDELSTDNIDPSFGDNLLVDITTSGDVLTVHLDTAPASMKIDPGESVTFTPTVSPPPSGPTTYAWDFGDGADLRKTDSGAVTHVYPVKGNFTAKLTVTARDDGSSGVESVQIQVGTPGDGGTATTPSDDTGLGGGGAAAGGGDKATGGRGTAGRDASNSGAAKQRKKSSKKGSTKTAKRKRSTSSAKRKRATSPAATTPDQTLPGGPATGTPATGFPAQQPGSGAPAKGQGAGREAPAGGARRRTQTTTATQTPGIRVRGVLLADTSAFAGALPSSTVTQSSDSTVPLATASASAGTPGGLVGWVGGGALFALVLAGGALLEVRMIARHMLPAT